MDEQPCLVCAKATTAKCGPCFAVGVDMRFCSRECQKLIWYAHKRFCGSAKPKLPLLSKEEANDAKQNRKVPAMYFTDGAEGPFSLEEMFQRFLRVPVGGDIGPMIDLVTEGVTRSDMKENLLLVIIRGVRWQREQIAGRIFDSPLDMLGNLELQLSMETRDPFVLAGLTPYLPLLRHRALILFAAVEQFSKVPVPPAHFANSDLPATYEVLLQWIDKDLARLTSPTVAKQVRDAMDRAFVMLRVKT
ncbi:hypothetical protein JCM10213_006144 [Rhodosporidiobolus nylandii]